MPSEASTPDEEHPAAEDTSEAERTTHPTSSGPSVISSSLMMAAGTTVSRLTGFVRTLVLAAALGTQLLGDAYNTANTLPFIVYDILIGGLMASVVVPFLVRRRKSDTDGGRATEQRLLTCAVLALVVITTTAVLLAEPLISLYAGGFTGPQHEVAVLLGRYLLVQILFIGVSGLTSAMLNARNRFAAPAWAPVLNNAVIITVGSAFLAVAGPHRTPETISSTEITLLGAGTTSGALVQAILLQWALRRAGFRWRLRLDLRGSGLGEAFRTAGWMLVLVGAMQSGFLITANLANRAGTVAAQENGVGAGLTAYNYAYQLFQLPYAIIAVSVITVLLPRMSAHAADHDWPSVRSDFSRGLRGSSALLVPLSLTMAVYAEPLCVAVFARGSTSVADAQVIASVLTVFALGLIPFTAYQLLLRLFYATGDTRTPALLAIVNMVVHALLAVLVYVSLPAQHVVVGIAAGFMVSYANGLFWGSLILSRRLGGLDTRRISSVIGILYVAAVPGIIGAWSLQTFWAQASSSLLLTYVAGPLVGVAIVVVTYTGLGYLLRIEEIRVGGAQLVSRLRPRSTKTPDATET